MESLVMLHWKFCKFCGNPIKVNQIETVFFNTESGTKEIVQEAYCMNNKCPTVSSLSDETKEVALAQPDL